MRAFRARSILLILVLDILLTNCAPTIPAALPAKQIEETPASTPGTPTAFVVQITGQTEITRNGWSPRARAALSPGADFHLGDVLFVPKGTHVTILCDDLELRQVDQGGAYGLREVCPESTVAMWTSDGETLSPPRGQDISIPYILRPRATNLLSDTPLLKWTSALGATRYMVQVKGDAVVFSTTTSLTETRYAGELLIPGKSYRVIVIPDTGTGLTDQSPARAFVVLPSDIAGQVRATVSKVARLGLSESNELLVISHIYRSYRLFAEAIDQLEDYLRQTSAVDGRLALQLGEMYIEIGLPARGGIRCEAATSAARATGDQDMLAQADVCLGQAQIGSGELDAAKKSLNDARIIYSGFGAQREIELIDSLLVHP